MTQKQFDFSRGDQLGLLDSLPVVDTMVSEGKSNHKVGAATIRATLRAIDSHCRGDRAGWPSDKRLAALIDRSERQVRRAIKALLLLKWIVVQSRPGRARLFSINWGEISLTVSRKSVAVSNQNPTVSFCETSELSSTTSELRARTSELGSDEADYKRKEKRGRNPKQRNPSKSDQMSEKMEAALVLAVRATSALRPSQPNDRQLIARAAVLAVTKLSERWWEVALGGVTRCATRKPMAKFRDCCRDHAGRLHDAEFDELCRDVAIPRTFYQRWQKQLGSRPTVRATVRPVGVDVRPNMQSRKRELLEQLAGLEK